MFFAFKIKKYKKTIVYNKNSVYFRMNNIMKLLTRKNKSMTIE